MNAKLFYIFSIQIFHVTGEKGQLWNRGQVQVSPLHKDNVFQFVFYAKNTFTESHPDMVGDIAIDDISLSVECQKTETTMPPTNPPTEPPEDCLETETSCQDDANTCVPNEKICDLHVDCPNSFDEAFCGSCTFEDVGLSDTNCAYTDESTGSFRWDNVQAGEVTGSPFQPPNIDHTTNSSSGHYLFVDHGSNIYGEEAVITGPVLRQTQQLCSLNFWYHMNGDLSQVLRIFSMKSQEDKTKIFQRESGGMDQFILWNKGVGLIGKQNGRRLELTATPDCNDMTTACNVVTAIDDLTLTNCQLSAADAGCQFDGGNFCLWIQDKEDDLDWEAAMVEDSEGEIIKLVNIETESKRATIESVVLPPDQKYCFSFDYKMYGDTIGALKLTLKSHDPFSLEPVVKWQRTGSQGNRWVSGQTQFKPSVPVSILMQGVVQGRYSPIYLDNLKLTLGNCPPTAECGFENGNCGWVKKGNLDWYTGTGFSTEGDQNTPDHDHTSKSSAGNFKYLPPIGNEGKRAILEYNKWKNGTRCLTLWYDSKDFNGFMQVRLRYKDGIANNISESMWEMPKYSLPSWQLAQVTLPDKEGMLAYKPQIYATVGTTNTSIMAIDDVQMREGACPKLDHCSFEEDSACGYGNFINDDFDWIRFSSEESSDFIGPPNDMTLESTEGHSYIAPLTGRKMGNSATFITTLIPKKYHCMIFYYNFWDSSKATDLKITLMQGGQQDVEIANIRQQTDRQWTQFRKK